ncbi:MAG: hypothetical protein KY393_06480, partial [Actinobacteria bacterium]|nr:hypothetical protein [Actinomycetota bacterium]
QDPFQRDLELDQHAEAAVLLRRFGGQHAECPALAEQGKVGIQRHRLDDVHRPAAALREEEGIEALAVPGRLIGLISHVGGIQARIDDLIILEKQPDGSTEVMQQEGPIGFAPSLI